MTARITPAMRRVLTSATPAGVIPRDAPARTVRALVSRGLVTRERRAILADRWRLTSAGHVARFHAADPTETAPAAPVDPEAVADLADAATATLDAVSDAVTAIHHHH